MQISIQKKLAKKAQEQRIPFKIIKIHGNEYMERGTPDLMMSIRGKMAVIETKMPGENPEPIQQVRLAEWSRSGAITGVAHSFEEAFEILKGVWLEGTKQQNIEGDLTCLRVSVVNPDERFMDSISSIISLGISWGKKVIDCPIVSTDPGGNIDIKIYFDDGIGYADFWEWYREWINEY